MFQRIFVNIILCPAAIGMLIHPFILENSEKYSIIPPIIGIALIAANINWCRNHLWHNSAASSEDRSSMAQQSIHSDNDITVPKVGSTLKRGVDLRK